MPGSEDVPAVGREVLGDMRSAGVPEDDIVLAEARLLGRAGAERADVEAAWRKVLDKYGFTAALVPPDLPVAALLRQTAGWRVVAEDKRAVLFLRMALLHLLRLLLMALLDLLPSRFGGVLFCESLVLFFLLAFKFLPVLLFLRVQLFLLLLVFAVLFRVRRVWRSRPLERRKVTRVDSATRVVAGWRVGWLRIASSGISRTAVNGAAFAVMLTIATWRVGRTE